MNNENLNTRHECFDHFQSDYEKDFLKTESSVKTRQGEIRFTEKDSFLELVLAANPSQPHPNGGPEWKSVNRYHYGEFSCRMKVARCMPDEEVVSSFFTFFHNQDAVPNRSEIDIEILGSEPENIYLTVWTHVEFGGKKQKRITRVIDMRQGSFKQSVLTADGYLQREHLFSPPDFPVTGKLQKNFPTFDASKEFYTYSFDWQEDCIKYHIEVDGEKILLWEFTVNEAIPKLPAYLEANIWWTDVHWDRPVEAKPPQQKTTHTFDWVKYKKI